MGSLGVFAGMFAVRLPYSPNALSDCINRLASATLTDYIAAASARSVCIAHSGQPNRGVPPVCARRPAVRIGWLPLFLLKKPTNQGRQGGAANQI